MNIVLNLDLPNNIFLELFIFYAHVSFSFHLIVGRFVDVVARFAAAVDHFENCLRIVGHFAAGRFVVDHFAAAVVDHFENCLQIVGHFVVVDVGRFAVVVVDVGRFVVAAGHFAKTQTYLKTPLLRGAFCL